MPPLRTGVARPGPLPADEMPTHPEPHSAIADPRISELRNLVLREMQEIGDDPRWDKAK